LYSSRLGVEALSGSVRASAYDYEATDGLFVSADLMLRANRRTRIDLAGGTGRTESSSRFLQPVLFLNQYEWMRLGLGVQAGAGVWLDVSHEWQTAGRGHELTVELGRVF
jgi:hypothetical protein